ncbi:biotin--[acetyl-CoA-carboxylase] ligase [Atopobium fossor]|uniref:biotin--[acetyl-CoA-carboxylase] ligase n=1 Tax=Atopobium fossor TaxID=39487 RepID=UPI000416C9C5|nr:hypothetical protein [Atopobium fossor]
MQSAQLTYLSSTKNIVDAAKDLARDGAVHATALFTTSQTEGRARMGRIWHSVDGSLHVALVLRPQVGMTYLNGLTTVCSLAVLDALRSLGAQDIVPKWPNDLMYKGNKLASIFVDAGYGEGVFAVCGVHLNVRQNLQLAQLIVDSFDGSPCPAAPAFLLDTFTEKSAKAASPNLSNEYIATVICDAMLARVSSWEQDVVSGKSVAGPIASVLNEYYDQMDLLTKQVDALLPDGRVVLTGMLAGMDIWGRVSLLDAEGREYEIAPEQASLRPAR